MRRSLLAVLVVILCAGGVGASTAWAKLPTFGNYDVWSVFHIAKSRNRNQVHYGVSLDERCRPQGQAPIYVYWREFEKGPRVVSPLLGREQPAYGLATQGVEKRTENAGRVVTRLRALKERPVTIDTFEEDGRCAARAMTEIGGQPAVLESVFVQFGALWSIRHIVLEGRSLQGDQPVKEIIQR
jgi:hypothetical protein